MEAKVISSIEYKKIIRKVHRTGMEEIEERRILRLYSDKITSRFHQFPMDSVHDFSFRKMSGSGGILFIHVDHGVYSYLVDTPPDQFIRDCKIIMNT